MTEKPFFSIIIPVYNVETYLQQCLDSVINQSFKDFEVIIINDGSTDGSLAICEGYASKYVQIKIINQENKGASYSRNFGITKATGQYIWFIDSDDYIADSALEVISNNLKENAVDLLGFSNYHLFDETNKIKENPVNLNTGVLKPIDFFDKGYVYETTPWISVIKTDFLRQHDISFDTKLVIYEDSLFMLQCLSKLNSLMYISDFLYIYRIRTDSLSSLNKNQSIRLIGYFELLKLCIKESKISTFPDFWYDNIYSISNFIYSIYFRQSKESQKQYLKAITKLKKLKFKFSKNDVFGVKIMKLMHNYCFPIYKLKLFK